MDFHTRTMLGLAVTVAWLAYPATLPAQSPYPAGTVTLVSPQSAGTTMDVLARIYAEKLSQRLGSTFIVSNRPGAGGQIAAQAVATSAPDGHTLLVANSGHAILGALNRKLPYDPIRDFASISMVGETPSLIVVTPGLGVRTLKEFVDHARANPGKINYHSAGIGTATHIAGAYFAHQAALQLVHVPYRSGSDGIADMLAGRVEALFAPAAFTLSLIKEGRLKALAVSSPTDMREPIAVPSARAEGVEYEYSTWYGFLAPAKTPKTVVEALNRAIADVSQDPDLKAKIIAQGIAPRFKPLADMDAHVESEVNRLRPVLDAIGAAANN